MNHIQAPNSPQHRTARLWSAGTGQPITPSLEHGGPVWHAVFTKNGLRVVTASEDKSARVWKLSKDIRPATELLRLAELLAAHEIDATGGFVPLDLKGLRERWQSLGSKFPSGFDASTVATNAWQRRR